MRYRCQVTLTCIRVFYINANICINWPIPLILIQEAFMCCSQTNNCNATESDLLVFASVFVHQGFSRLEIVLLSPTCLHSRIPIFCWVTGFKRVRLILWSFPQLHIPLIWAALKNQYLKILYTFQNFSTCPKPILQEAIKHFRSFLLYRALLKIGACLQFMWHSLVELISS